MPTNATSFLWDLLRLWPRGGSGAGKRP